MNSIKKVLILAANPSDTVPLKLGEEIRKIEEGLLRSKNRDQFVVETKLAVRLSDLRRALLDSSPQIVHFCGHGEVDGLKLINEDGETTSVDSETLSKLFELFSKRGLECVILNACDTEPLADAIKNYIDFVVGMNQAIEDKAAIEFAMGFYDGLGGGMSYEEAFTLGCAAIPKHLNPILKKKSDYLNTRVQPTHEIEISKFKKAGIILSSAELPAFVVGSPILHPRCFFGRERELKRLFGLFKYIPLQNAAIIGPRRSGKTSLLQQLKNLATMSSEQLRIQQHQSVIVGFSWTFKIHVWAIARVCCAIYLQN
jgi:hypothetical protein